MSDWNVFSAKLAPEDTKKKAPERKVVTESLNVSIETLLPSGVLVQCLIFS